MRNIATPIYINRNTLKHIVFWLIITFMIASISSISDSLINRILGTSLIMCIYIALYYFLGYIIYPYLWEYKILLAIVLLVSFSVYDLIYYITARSLLPIVKCESSMTNGDILSFVKASSFMYSILAASSLVLYKNKQNINRIKVQNESEKQLIKKELDFLKNQFNSHLTFNFLSYCYNSIYKISDETASIIEDFSDLLRSSLTIKSFKPVKLSEEIESVTKYIKLQTAITSKVDCDFTIKTEIAGVRIAPFVLTSLTDIAIKSCKPINNIKKISISLEIVNKEIIFSLTFLPGKFKEDNLDTNKLEEYLNVFYPNKYELKKEYQDTITYNLRLQNIDFSKTEKHLII